MNDISKQTHKNNIPTVVTAFDTQNEEDNIENINLIESWQQVNKQVAQACAQAPRQNNEVTLLAVSKTKPAEMVATLARQGQRDFGENYLQEALEKIQVLREQPACKPIIWHYIGSIQRNKTRDIAEHFDWVQTLEREIIAKRLNEQRPAELPPLNVLIQVNIDNEDSKSGCLPAELPALISAIKHYERLQLRGLMIIPAKANTDAFARTKQLFEDIKIEHPELPQWDTLSMGMSGDMGEAIANGSTMVRVGTAIFGARA